LITALPLMIGETPSDHLLGILVRVMCRMRQRLPTSPPTPVLIKMRDEGSGVATNSKALSPRAGRGSGESPNEPHHLL